MKLIRHCQVSPTGTDIYLYVRAHTRKKLTIDPRMGITKPKLPCVCAPHGRSGGGRGGGEGVSGRSAQIPERKNERASERERESPDGARGAQTSRAACKVFCLLILSADIGGEGVKGRIAPRGSVYCTAPFSLYPPPISLSLFCVFLSPSLSLSSHMVCIVVGSCSAHPHAPLQKIYIK